MSDFRTLATDPNWSKVTSQRDQGEEMVLDILNHLNFEQLSGLMLACKHVEHADVPEIKCIMSGLMMIGLDRLFAIERERSKAETN